MIKRIGIVLLALLVLAGIGLVLLRGRLVEAASRTLVRALGASLKTELTVSGVAFSWTDLIRLKPAVALQRIVLKNPPGFPDAPMLTADEIAAQVALAPLWNNRLEVMSLVIRKPVVRVEHNQREQTNLEVWVAGLGGDSRPSGAAEKRELLVESFLLENGQVRLARGGKDTLVLDDIELRLNDFVAGQQCRLAFSARPHHGARSRVSLESTVGPLGTGKVPMNGNVRAELAPAEIPKPRRRELFGDFLAEPGDRGVVTLEAAVVGDAAGSVRGDGKLKLSEVWVGKSSDRRLLLEGEAPLRLEARKLMSSPEFSLAIPKGSLSLGRSRWDGRLEVNVAGESIRGSSSGAIRNVDINELLSSFTTAEKAIFGRGEIAQYRLAFGGRGADAIRNSLNGDGRIALNEGRIALFDLVSTIRQHAARVLGGEQAAAGQTDFTRFGSGFQIQNGRLLMNDMELENSSLGVTGKGGVGFDRTMQFDLLSLVRTEILQNAGGAIAAVAGSQKGFRVPLRVSGTLEKPKVRPDLSQMLKGSVQGILERFLKKDPSKQ